LSQAREMQAAQQQEAGRRAYGATLTPEEQIFYMAHPEAFIKSRDERNSLDAQQKALAIEQSRNQLRNELERREAYSAYVERLPEEERPEAQALGPENYAKKQLDAQLKREETQRKEAEKAAEAAAKKAEADAGDLAAIENSLNQIRRAREAIDEAVFVGGLSGKAASILPFTDTWDLDYQLQSTAANIAADTLRELKRSTGSVGGSTSDQEQKQYKSRFWPIEIGASEKQLLETLAAYEANLLRQRKRLQGDAPVAGDDSEWEAIQ